MPTILDIFLVEEHRRIYKWLGDVDHANLQQNGIAQRRHLIRQTGKWFIEGSHFTRWLQTDGAKLWVHGIRMSFCVIVIYKLIAAFCSRGREDNSGVIFIAGREVETS